MQELNFDELEVGEAYGPLEYVLTQEKLDLFREVVDDPGAVFPTIASKDYSNLLRTRYAPPMVINAKHESWYSNPPRVGERVRTRGHLADKYVKRERQFIVIETQSEGEAGRELVRSRTTLMLGPAKRGTQS